MATFKDRQELTRHQQENERWFCAAAFTNPAGAIADCAWLDPEWFVDDALGLFWHNLLQHGDPAQAAHDVSNRMFTELTQLVVGVPSTSQPDLYARAIREACARRHLLSNLGEVAKLIYRAPIQEVHDHVNTLGDNLMIPNGHHPDLNQVHQQFVKANQGQGRGIPTHIKDLDVLIGNLQPQDAVIVAARTSMGKTTFVGQVARNIAMHDPQQAKVLYFSLETPAAKLWERWVCGAVGYATTDLRRGVLSASQLADLEAMSKQLAWRYSDRLVLYDEAWTVADIHQICVTEKPQVVIVDHLEEIHWPHKQDKETIWRGKAFKYLRTYVARKLDCVLVVVHQLSRGVEQRQDKRPRKSDLRWDGSLEQLADLLIFLHRDDYYENDPGTNANLSIAPTEVIVDKNRHGPLGVVNLEYDLLAQWFQPTSWKP